MLIIKSIRNLTLMIVTVLLASGCLQQIETENNEADAAFSSGPVSLQVRLGGTSRAERFLGSFDEIDRLALDVHRKFDGAQVVNDLALTQQSGVWTGTLNNLIISFEYTITGHAYKTADNGSSIEIFRGSTNKVIDSDNITLTLRLAPMLDERELSVPRITRINRPFQMEKNTSETLQISLTNSDKELVQYRFRSINDQTGLPLSAVAGGSFAPATGVQHDNGTGYSDITSVYTAPDNISVQHLQVRVTNDVEIGVSSTFKTYVTGPIDSQTTVDTNPVIESISAERLADSSLLWTLLVSDDEDFDRMVAHWEYVGGASWMRSFDPSVYTEITDDSRNDLGLGRIETVMQGYVDSDDGILRVTVCEDMPGHSGTCVYGVEGSTSIVMELIAYAYQKPIICDGTDCSSNKIVDADNKVPRFLTMDSSGGGVNDEDPPEITGTDYIPVYEVPRSKAVYSDDGFNWKEGSDLEIELNQTPDITPMLNLVVHDGTHYLALDNGSASDGSASGSWIYQSTDGSAWNPVGIVRDNISWFVDHDNGTTEIHELVDSLTHFVYGGGTYLAVAQREAQLNYYCYGGPYNYYGRWLSCSGNSPAKTQTIVSSDGINWNPGSVDMSFLHDNGSDVSLFPNDVIFDGSDFVAIADGVGGDNATLISSPDGISWAQLGAITGDVDSSQFRWIKTYDNGSTDNVTLEGGLNHLLYGNGKYVAIVNIHEINKRSSSDTPYLSSGYSYYLKRNVDYSEGLYKCRYNQYGNTLRYIYGTNSNYDFYPECNHSERMKMQTLVSTDGTTWTPEDGNPDVRVLFDYDNGTTDNITVSPDAFTFHDGKFLGFDNQSVISSTDGINWSYSASQFETKKNEKLFLLSEHAGKLLGLSIQRAFNDYCQHPSTGNWGNWPECSHSTPDKMQVHQSGDDGLTWSSLHDDSKVSLSYTTKEALKPEHVIFGNNRYIALLDSTVESGRDTHTAIGSSEDGLSWSYWGSLDPGLLDETLDGIRHVSYGNERYVAVAASDSGMRYKYIPAMNQWNWVYEEGLMQTLVSENGATWTLGNGAVEVNLPSGGVGPIVPTAMTYANNEFLATDGSVVISSTDGISWSNKSSFNEALPVTALSYGGGKYAALAIYPGSGYPRTYNSWSNILGRDVLYPSENLLWCSQDADGNYLGNTDVYDECQESSEVWTSSDGVSWQEASLSFTFDNSTGTFEAYANTHMLVHGDGSFFAYDVDNNSVMTSTNGQNWSRNQLLDASGGDFSLPSDNNSLLSYGVVLDNLTSSDTTTSLQVIRIGPGNDPEESNYRYVYRSRAKKVFVTFNRPVTFGQDGSYYSGSGKESCDNFDVQYYRTSDESQCYLWNSAPSTYGDSVEVDGTIYAQTWVFTMSNYPDSYNQHRIRIKSSSSLVDQSGNSLDEDFVTGPLYIN